MKTHFLAQLTKQLPAQTNFLIALSGGVDSVALLRLFCQLRQAKPLNLRAVHIHHGLSDYADDWAAFCHDLCEKWNVPLVVEKVKVGGKNGVEANARHARYHAISQIIQPNEMLATAHHLDDQAETFFLALKRGSGVKGLAAMQGVGLWQDFAIFRPLLAFSKAEILAFAQAENLSWIVDESNENNAFDRNFLRNQILPQLNQRWPQFSQMVARTSQLCREQQQLLEELLADELHSRFDPVEQSLNIAGFPQFSRLKQQQLVRLWLAKCGEPMPSQAQLTQILENLVFAETDKNPQVKIGEKVVRRYQQKIFLTAAKFSMHCFEIILSAPTQVPLFSKEGIGEIWQAKNQTHTQINDRNQISPTPSFLKRGADLCNEFVLPNHLGTLTRTPTELFCKIGAKFSRLPLPLELQNQPLTIKINVSGKVKLYGRPHHEEMKKIWQKNGVPVWERSRTPVVFWGDELVAVLPIS